MSTFPSGLSMHGSGAGPSLVWAHGMMGSMAAEDAIGILRWDRFPGALRLLRYDARGHGGSVAPDNPQQCTWPALARDMLAVADAWSAARFTAGGWSMGCASALHAALLAPARIDGLVLVLPPSLWEARAAQAVRYRRALRLCQAIGPARFARLAGADAGLPPWLLQAAPHLGAGTRIDPLAIAHLLEGAALSNLPAREKLAALAAIPALIVAWIDDPAHPLASAQELHRLLPASRLLIASTHEQVLGIPAAIHGFLAEIATRNGSILPGR